MNKILIGVLAALALAACSTTPKQEGGAPVDERTPGATTPGAATSGAADGIGRRDRQPGRGQTNPLKDPSSILSKRSVYFDFDATRSRTTTSR